MIWKYCEDCHINGHCENQDRGRECNVYAKRITEKAELLQIQLDIAVKALNTLNCEKLVFQCKDGTIYEFKGTFKGKHVVGKALAEIEELNKCKEKV